MLPVTTLDEALAGVLLNRFKALRKYMLRRMDDVGRDYVTDADVRLDRSKSTRLNSSHT